ncbi:MAG: nuclear transport factor 2 family protein [Roseateles sp.]
MTHRPLLVCRFLCGIGLTLATASLAAEPSRLPLAERSARMAPVAQAYFKAYIDRDWDRLEPLLDETARFADPTADAVFGMSTARNGKTRLMLFFRNNYGAIRAMSFTPSTVWASGEFAVFVGELDWTLALPDGRLVRTRMPLVTRLHVRDGRVLEHVDVADCRPFEVALQASRDAPIPPP